MSARDIIASECDEHDPIQHSSDALAGVIIDRLRAAPAAVLSLLPEDVRADIRGAVEYSSAWHGPTTGEKRLLDLLARSEQP